MVAARSSTVVRVALVRRPWVGPAAAAAVILLAGWWGLLQPQWQRWQQVRGEAAAAVATASQLDAYEQQLEAVEQQYQVIRRDAVRSVARLDKLVPARLENAQLFSEFQQLVAQTGLVLGSVRISPATGGTSPRAHVLSLSVAGGNYPALKRLLVALEQNLRLTDVVNLTFDSSVQSYAITARVYSTQ